MKRIALLAALFCCALARAQTFVTSFEAHVTGTANPTITAAGLTAGDTLIVATAIGGNAHATGCSDSVAGETVNLDYAPNPISQNSVYRGEAFCSLVDIKTAGSHTITVALNGPYNVQIYALEVVLGTTPKFDQAPNLTNGESASPISNSVTPTHYNSFLVALLVSNTTGETFSSWTNSFTADNATTILPNSADAYLIQTTPTAVSAGATLSASDYWIAGVAVYYEGSASGILLSGGSVVLIGGKPVIVP